MIQEFSIGPRYYWFTSGVGGLIILALPFLVEALGQTIFTDQLNIPYLSVGFGVSSIIGGSLILHVIYLKAARHYLLTNERVIETIGLLSQRTVTAEYSQITDMRVTQDPFERLVLGTGYVGVNTAGGEREEIKLDRVAAPYQLCHKIRELCEERLKRTGAYHQPPKVVEGPPENAKPLTE